MRRITWGSTLLMFLLASLVGLGQVALLVLVIAAVYGLWDHLSRLGSSWRDRHARRIA